MSKDKGEFFRRTGRKAVEQAIKVAGERMALRAACWIRPPYALVELEFLLACTRCDACREACPHGLIFPLSARVGLAAAATPALDLSKEGCRLCADWPCVAACEPGALKRPEGDPGLPRLGVARVDPEVCRPYRGSDCRACADSCPVPGAMEWRQGRPRINPAVCVGCGLCRAACVLESKAIEIHSRAAR